ncbi:MAG: neutral/alkaline non-lysosomal ceramidase N-terminal domain-containing protein [Anaerolineae bacterium]
MTGDQLYVGFGSVEITPPVGLPIAGSLRPRESVGVADPLMARSLVVQSGDSAVAIVGADLLALPRELADRAIAEASRQTGIAPSHVLICCSHTHSGPYTMEGLYSFGVTDQGYVDRLSDLIAESVAQAWAGLQPCTAHIGRAIVQHNLEHRRLLCKDGTVYSVMMRDALNDLELCPQIVGSAGPIDPEMWVLRFDDAQGGPLGTLVNFGCHLTSRGGTRFSADYAGVIDEKMRGALGEQATTVFTLGACGNIKPCLTGERWREGAEGFAAQAVAAAMRARPLAGRVVVDAVRRDLAVPRRDPATQAAEAIARMRYEGAGDRAEVFVEQMQVIGRLPETLSVPVSAARIGPFAIATNPGELFVEHGLSIKQRSPFPHTVVAELTNDAIFYQPTREAFAQMGYETLVGPNRVSIEGIERIVSTAVELLDELWTKE